jgi:hypothetical protein
VVLKYVLPASRDVERATLQRDQAFTYELEAAIDEACDLGAIGSTLESCTSERSGSSGCPRSAVYAQARPLLAHPRHRGRGIETTGERDADAFADRQ